MSNNTTIVRKGKIFESGDFADKNFSVTPEELRAAAQEFTPVQVDLEHKSTVLDNKLGVLKSVSVSEDGRILFGEYEEPSWLGQVLGSIERKASLTWDRASKRITGMALVLEPRIPDSVLFSKYAAIERGEEVEPFVVTPSTVLIVGGAVFSTPIPLDEKNCLGSKQSVFYNHSEQENHMSTTVTGVEEKPQEIPASMWDKLKAALGLSDAQVSHAQASFSKTPREIELEAEIARRDAAAFTAQQGQRDAQATALAEALLKEHRIKPYQLEAVKAEFARALDDDARAPLTVNFSTEATATEQAKTVAMSRTDRLKELYAQLPADEVGTEQVREFGQETYAAFTQEATRMRNAGDEDKVDFAEVNKARAEMGLEPLQAV